MTQLERAILYLLFADFFVDAIKPESPVALNVFFAAACVWWLGRSVWEFIRGTKDGTL